MNNSENIGFVQIADDVVAVIAGIATTEVDGVASMAGNISKELISKLGMKNLSKGVKVQMEDGVAVVDVAVNIEYGYNIPTVCEAVQDKVKNAIENMTGLTVNSVNVTIAGVAIEK